MFGERRDVTEREREREGGRGEGEVHVSVYHGSDMTRFICKEEGGWDLPLEEAGLAAGGGGLCV